MRSGFFDSEITGYNSEGMPIFDRAENAAFFARYFGQFLTNGVYRGPEDALRVSPGTGLAVRVQPGTCCIRGYMGMQEAQEELALAAPSAAERVDGVFARLSLLTRDVSLAVGTGRVEPERTDDVCELLLAEVAVRPGAAAVTAADVADRRSDEAVCGFVAGLADFTRVWTELGKKAPTESPTFTGTVRGVTKAMVGLGNADNTSDAGKPVSAAAQAALDKKVDKVSGKGLSTNDYTSAEKSKLAGVAAGANNYTHPGSHPASMITGLAKVAASGSYNDLSNKPPAYVHPSSHPASMITGLSTVAASGSYADLSGRPSALAATATISTTWTGGAAPYTQNVAVSGVTAAMQPLVSPVYDAALSAALLQQEAWACVSRAASYDGGIAFTCFKEKPNTEIPIQIKVVG